MSPVSAPFGPEETAGGIPLRTSEQPAGVMTGTIDAPGVEPNGDNEALEPGLRARYFGDYALLKELGRGAMGVVYKARQISLDRLVALKMIKSGALAEEEDLRRFQNEAEAVARLDHPQIVPIYEIGEHDGNRYFSMKLIGGPCLQKVLARYAADPNTAAKLMATVADAVHHAHQRGILHRDLKPSNIVLDERGEPHVTDFGLAKRVEGVSELTISGAVVGTPAYMAPEQASGIKRLVTVLSGVYGLGAVLYALLTGEQPFGGDTVLETLDRVRGQQPKAPSRLNSKVPRDLEVICLKCLEKDPQRRYASAQALADDLRHYLGGEPIVARPVRALERAIKWARRRPAIAGLTAAAVAATLFGLISTSLALHTANAQTELAEQRLYDTRMNLLQQHWEDYHGELFQQGLAEQLPSNHGGIDRRGFEWFYWQRKFSSGHITLKGHTGTVYALVFSPDGERIASAGSDRTIQVWEAGTGQKILTLKGHRKEVLGLAFRHDAKRIASASADGTVKVWDAGGGQEVLTLKGHPGEESVAVAYSPDGKRLASGGWGRTVMVWDAETGKEILTPKGREREFLAMAFSADQKRLAGGSFDETVKIRDARTGQEMLSLKGLTARVTSVAFRPDGKRLATGSSDGTVKVWDAATGQEGLTLKGHIRGIRSVAYSPDGMRIASGSEEGTVKVWDAETGQETVTLVGHSPMVGSVAFSQDGNRLASASKDGTVRVWDSNTAQETLKLAGHSFGVEGVAFSPDGKRLASAGFDRTVRVWEATTGQEILTLKGHTGPVRSVTFNPDGGRLASASDDGTVRLWDAGKGQQVLTLKGHTSPVVGVAFSPDDKRVASASLDGTAKLWDTWTGQETLTLKGHAKDVLSVAFSPDGHRLASSGRDGTVKIWDARPLDDDPATPGSTQR